MRCLQNPCAEESVNHLGIEWKGEVYVYVRMPFGVSSAPAAQQTLLCALMRAVMRRWTVAVRRRPPRSETPQLAKAFTVGRAVSA